MHPDLKYNYVSIQYYNYKLHCLGSISDNDGMDKYMYVQTQVDTPSKVQFIEKKNP